MGKPRKMYFRRAALISSLLAPILFIGATIAGEQMFPGFNPMSQTISELAALTAPTHVFVTVIFLCTAVCHVVTAGFTPGIGIPGRVALGLAGVATFTVGLFPLPTVEGTSAPHRTAAIIGFVLLAVWPVLGMRVRAAYPWIVRPWAAVGGTVFLGALCLWFLGVWSSPTLGYVGLVERLAADAESPWPAVVVVTLFVAQRRRARQLA